MQWGMPVNQEPNARIDLDDNNGQICANSTLTNGINQREGQKSQEIFNCNICEHPNETLNAKLIHEFSCQANKKDGQDAVAPQSVPQANPDKEEAKLP